MKCVRESDGWEIVRELEPAQTFSTRLLGLMFRRGMKPGGGLWLEPCKQIHMFFMRFAIDVVFLDECGLVVYTLENFKPWRLSPIVWKARGVLELPSGTLQGRLRRGDRVVFVRPGANN